MNLDYKIPAGHKRIFEIVQKAATSLNQKVYVVGGYVRDYYLNRADFSKTDIDMVTIGSGIKLAEEVSRLLKTSTLSVYNQFGTAQIKTENLEIEFVGARKESYRKNSRKPLVEDGSFEDDQLRRDLTINAMSWSLNPENYGELIDPFNGLDDLKNKLIRTPIDPVQTFSDDPLRMMRAIRFAAQLTFDIEKKTLKAISDMAQRIEIISKERIIDELNKIILTDVPSIGFAYLFETGLLKYIFPQLHNLHGIKEINGHKHKDNFWHTLQVLDNVATLGGGLWLRWAAIMHDIAKPPTQRYVEGTGWTFHGHDSLGAKWTKDIFRQLGLPLDERMRYVRKLVRLHLRPIALAAENVSDSAIRRLIYEAGNDIFDLMTLCRADITSSNESKIEQYLANFDFVERKIKEVEKKDNIRNWKNPVSGDELMKLFNLPAGPDIGKLKNAVKEAVLNGEIPNEKQAAVDFIRANRQSILIS